MKLHIASMTCGGCVRAVTATIKEIDPAASVDVDLDTRTVRVESHQPSLAFESALIEAGFPPVLQPA
jgi:copper chaperone